MKSSYPAIGLWVILAMSPHRGLGAAEIQRAYLDARQRVHVVTPEARKLRLSGKRAIELTVSPDRTALAWLAVDVRGQVESDDLRLYHGGRVHRLNAGPQVRQFRFRQEGRQLAVSFAGHHGGWQELYDTRTQAVIASFDEADPQHKRQPAWAVANK